MASWGLSRLNSWTKSSKRACCCKGFMPGSRVDFQSARGACRLGPGRLSRVIVCGDGPRPSPSGVIGVHEPVEPQAGAARLRSARAFDLAPTAKNPTRLREAHLRGTE